LGFALNSLEILKIQNFVSEPTSFFNHPSIEEAYFSAFRGAMTRLDSLYHLPLSGGWYRLSTVLIPWAGATKYAPSICVLGVEKLVSFYF
jgi:hypothetical protein